QIVGIVGDVHDNGLDEPPQPTVFVPGAQLSDTRNSGRTVAWVIRTRTRSASLNSAILNELREATQEPVPPLHSMQEITSQSTARQRFNMLLMTIFGASALLLASIGIYGLMAYSVQQRTHEMGIRMAIGARSGEVRKMVVFQGMRLALTGMGIGIAAALGLTRFIAGLLFGVEALDPLTFVLVPILLSAVALLAVWLPAQRASRVDPIQALRHE
ncbi:MAG: FtsX-like permease family protein, partial [Acidobacteriaceae bacterium]|nr:FtsX-like permease family protein [Acidobacteriaceae bacterium]